MARFSKKPLILPQNASAPQRQVYGFLRAHPDVTVNGWATEAGISEGTIRNALSSEGGNMTSNIYEKLNKAAIQLKGRPLTYYDKTKATLVGRVGAGAMVHIFTGDSSQNVAELIDSPEGIENNGDLEAVEIEGNSMLPFRAGWRVFYRRTHMGVTDGEIGQLCVICLTNGTRYLKEILRGYEPGKFNLVSWSDVQMDNQEIEWAAKVVSIVPR